MAPPGTARTGVAVNTSTPPPALSAPAAPSAPPTTASSSAQSFDLADPLFAIQHLARVFRLEVDTARDLTYREDFPQPIKIGRRWLWFPDEVLAWSRKQKRYSVTECKRNTVAADPTPTPQAIKPYRARAPKPEGAAA